MDTVSGAWSGRDWVCCTFSSNRWTPRSWLRPSLFSMPTNRRRACPRDQFHGLSVRFAVKYESADALIEELIQADFTPKQLTVVSSDHRIQRAAQRRKARAVDSEVWYAEVMRRRSQAERPRQPATRPATPLVAGEVARWLEQFGGEAIVEQVIQEERSKGSAPVRPATPVPPARPAAPSSQQAIPGRKKAAHPGSAKNRRNVPESVPSRLRRRFVEEEPSQRPSQPVPARICGRSGEERVSPPAGCYWTSGQRRPDRSAASNHNPNRSRQFGRRLVPAPIELRCVSSGRSWL